MNREAWVKLARSAANLNQLAHSVNAGEAAQVEQIRVALDGFRLALIGAAQGQEDQE